MRKEIKSFLQTLRWALLQHPLLSFTDRLRLLADFLCLRREKGLDTDEYDDFHFGRQPNDFRQSFLGLNEQRYYLDYLNPIKYYSFARNKYVTHKMLENTGVRQAELYCYYEPEGHVIESDEIANDVGNVSRILRKKGVSECVIKPAESSHGDNVWVVRNIDYAEKDCRLTLFDGRIQDLSEILGCKPLIFESVIQQTAQFAAFNRSSVNTIRFMTALYPDGRARLVATFIKIGRDGKCVDNAGGGGNVDACVAMDTGELKYVIQFDGWEKIKDITHHPDSGNRLEGVKIESWDSIVAQVLHFQECFPCIKAAGWDIAITDEGPVVIEVNDMWDRTGQYFLRVGWRDEIRDCYLAWKRTGMKYNLQRQPNKLGKTHLQKIAGV